MSENDYDRFSKDIERFRETHQRVEDLIHRVVSVTERLIEWETLGFEGAISGQQSIASKSTRRVRLDEMPTLEEIYHAKQKWLDVISEAKGTLAAMSHDQQEQALSFCGDIADYLR